MPTKVEREIANQKKLEEAVKEIKELKDIILKLVEGLNEPKKGKSTKKTS